MRTPLLPELKGVTSNGVVILLAMVLTLGGCAVHRKNTRTLMPTPLGLALGITHSATDRFQAYSDPEVPVFVISGRNLEPDAKGPDPFGNARSHVPSFGIAKVRIGDGLTQAELYRETIKSSGEKKAKVEFDEIEMFEKLESVTPWLLKDDVVRHADNPWVKELNRQLDNSQNRDVCIFVHGYNTSFIDNTLLAAEIFHYRGRRGAMISFEWPSEESLLGYLADKGNATFSTRHFRALISNLAKECNVDTVTIIAHSAGTPIVVNALREIRLLEHDLPADELQKKYRVDRVVLAAPDMDLMSFVNAIHDRFYELATGVAVYASPNDRALEFSQILYSEKRLGASVGQLAEWEKEVLLGASQIEMIDSSKAVGNDRNFLGHSYFHRDPWVSSDIGSFMLGKTPESRGLTREPGSVFWEFPGDYPERLRQHAHVTAYNFSDEE